MWGIRAVRVGVLLGALLAVVAGSGCCHCCESLWGGEETVPATQPDGQVNECDPTSDWHGDGRFKDQPAHLTPERIHGGIY